jgi:hypothetical protein
MQDVEISPKAAAPEPIADPAPQSDASDLAPTGGAPEGKGIPPGVLKIPAIQALLAGAPSAVSAPIKEFESRAEGKLIVKNAPILQRAGFGMYRSLSGDTGVLFNQVHLHAADLVNADKAGKLNEIAPSFDSINDAIAKSGKDHPVLKSQGVPNGFKGPSMPTPPQMNPPQQSMPMPGPGPAQLQANRARLANMAVGGPISGASPGSGRILNNITKSAI